MQPVTQNVYKKKKQVSTLLITQEQLRKSAGKPQCKDGLESTSVSADARSSFQHYVCPQSLPAPRSGASITCETAVVSYFLV